MSKQDTTDKVQSPAANSDQPSGGKKQASVASQQHPEEARQTQAGATPEQRPKEIEKPAAVITDSHSEPANKPRSTLRRFAPILVLLIAAALLFVITANWNSWVGSRGSQKTD